MQVETATNTLRRLLNPSQYERKTKFEQLHARAAAACAPCGGAPAVGGAAAEWQQVRPALQLRAVGMARLVFLRVQGHPLRWRSPAG